MELKYINYLECDSQYKNEIKRIYTNSFPKSERFPFWIFKYCLKEKNIAFKAILAYNILIGMEYIINYDNIAYLMYLAIDEKHRGKGYGSKVLEDLTKKHETVILSIERPNKDLKDNRQIRKDFYLRNGFFTANKFFRDSGIEYEILCTNKEYNITKEVLEKRYLKMTDSTIMKYLIRKMFDAKVCFIK